MRDQRRVGIFLADLRDARVRELDVDVTVALPEPHLAPGFFHHPLAQILVRHEKDFAIGRHMRTIFSLRIARGADHIAQRLHLRGAVDIGHDVDAGMQRLVGGQFARIARLGQRAAGVHVRQQDLLGRVHDLRRLGHEMDAAKENDIRVGRLRLVGKAERIADIIGHFLDFLHLIVMRENDGVLLLLQGQDFLLQRDSSTGNFSPCGRGV